MAPGVQIALQTSPQRPLTQPPPGGPSGKLERDSAGRPGAARAGARAEPSHTPPSPALPAQMRGGGWAGHKNEQQPRRGERWRSRAWFVGPPLAAPRLRRRDSQTTQGPGGKVGRGYQPYRPLSHKTRESGSFRMSLTEHPPPQSVGASSKPVAPAQLRAPLTISERGKKIRSCSLTGHF